MHGISTGLLGLLMTFLAGSLEFTNERRVTSVEAASTAAPEFELITLSGAAYSNASLKGKPALLMFWAPWCRVCQRELPSIARFYQQERPDQLQVISVGFADTRSNVEAYVHAQAATFVFPTAYDEDRWVSQSFKINATPTYVVIDAGGNIVLVHRGSGILQNSQFRQFLLTVRN